MTLISELLLNQCILRMSIYLYHFMYSLSLWRVSSIEMYNKIYRKHELKSFYSSSSSPPASLPFPSLSFSLCFNPGISFLVQNKVWWNWLPVSLINTDVLDAAKHHPTWSIIKGKVVLQEGHNYLLFTHSFIFGEKSLCKYWEH